MEALGEPLSALELAQMMRMMRMQGLGISLAERPEKDGETGKS